MKILSIGNSFSQDAQSWLHTVARVNGTELTCVNLYIGGCSLERHWNNVLADSKDYPVYLNGVSEERMVSISEALDMDEWDIITVQQVSGHSGRPQSYFPYLTLLADYVRERKPEAKLYFHKTWAYEIDSEHPHFHYYNHDQAEMYRRICDSAEMASKLIEAELIPVGDVIQKLRSTLPVFDYKAGGLSLCRDGFHLSLDYGRYAAAATWLAVFTGKRVSPCDLPDFDMEIVKGITEVVNKVVFCKEKEGE